jgi:hypothetical protein
VKERCGLSVIESCKCSLTSNPEICATRIVWRRMEGGRAGADGRRYHLEGAIASSDCVRWSSTWPCGDHQVRRAHLPSFFTHSFRAGRSNRAGREQRRKPHSQPLRVDNFVRGSKACVLVVVGLAPFSEPEIDKSRPEVQQVEEREAALASAMASLDLDVGD